MLSFSCVRNQSPSRVLDIALCVGTGVELNWSHFSGNATFIGHLIVRGMLTFKIFPSIVEELLSDRSLEFRLEAAAKLITVAEPILGLSKRRLWECGDWGAGRQCGGVGSHPLHGQSITQAVDQSFQQQCPAGT